MFEEVRTYVNPHNAEEFETVQRVHPENLHQVKKFVHFPTKLSPIYHLDCSCGYSGDVHFNGKDVVKCPNCKSETVHPDSITEESETHIHVKSGDKHIIRPKKQESRKNVKENIVMSEQSFDTSQFVTKNDLEELFAKHFSKPTKVKKVKTEKKEGEPSA